MKVLFFFYYITIWFLIEPAVSNTDFGSRIYGVLSEIYNNNSLLLMIKKMLSSKIGTDFYSNRIVSYVSD